MNQIVSLLLAAGGLGFINYYVSEKLDLLNFTDENTNMRLPYMLCWEVFDFSIYLLIKSGLSHCLVGNTLLAASLITTMILIFFIMILIAPSLSCILYKIINWRRKTNNRSEINKQRIWKSFFGEVDTVEDYTEIYIFSLDGNYINSGFMEDINMENDDYSMDLIPFRSEIEPIKLTDFLNKYKNDTSVQLKEYMDFDRKMIFVKILKLDK